MGEVLAFKPRSKSANRPSQPNEKFDALIRHMERGIAMIHLDSRINGVDVPWQHKSAWNLRLNLSWKFEYINLAFDDEGLSATLTFSGKPHRCMVPWKAIYAITSPHSREYLSLQDLPEEAVAR